MGQLFVEGDVEHDGISSVIPDCAPFGNIQLEGVERRFVGGGGGSTDPGNSGSINDCF